MSAEEGDCVVQVVSAFSDESICTLQLPSSSTVLDVKRRVQATQGINRFRQRLIISPAGPQVKDHEVLATLSGLRLQLIRLECTDDDEDEIGKLLHAAEEGVAPEVERLLRLPLKPDCTLDKFGATALMLASRWGHLEVVRLLSEAGADKDKAGFGETGLIWASICGHLEVVQLLCDAGADKDKACRRGYTALMWASTRGHLEVARLLCEAGADKDKAKQNGATALTIASAHGHLDVARLLCESGADMDKANHGVCVFERTPGGGPAAMRGRGRQGQGDDSEWSDGLDLGFSHRAPGGGPTALRCRRRQGQGGQQWCHGLDGGVYNEAPGGGPTALRGWRRQGQGDAGWCHGLDVRVHPRAPGGGAAAL